MLLSKKDKKSIAVILFIALLVIIAVFSSDPYPQPICYHDFADQNSCCHIPHFLNVVTNLPFIVVGLLGIYHLSQDSCQILKSHRLTYMIFFMGVALVGFGSSYYHLNPTNETILWDRTPMTLAFMALFTFVIAEFISEKFALKVRYPFLVLGLFSVVYWAWSESQNAGDLRLYFLIQFVPILIIPIILLRFKSTFSHVKMYWYLLIAYIVAKVFETFDHAVYEFLGFISGHSLKHLIAALGIWFLLLGFRERAIS